jgi:hypothetical protein
MPRPEIRLRARLPRSNVALSQILSPGHIRRPHDRGTEPLYGFDANVFRLFFSGWF